jgi:hypothetical protein
MISCSLQRGVHAHHAHVLRRAASRHQNVPIERTRDNLVGLVLLDMAAKDMFFKSPRLRNQWLTKKRFKE